MKSNQSNAVHSVCILSLVSLGLGLLCWGALLWFVVEMCLCYIVFMLYYLRMYVCHTCVSVSKCCRHVVYVASLFLKVRFSRMGWVCVEIILVLMFINWKKLSYDRALLQLPDVVKRVYVLGLFVIYVAVSDGGERLEQKSMIPPVAYLWLHQTLGLSAGWKTGLRYGERGWRGISDEDWQRAVRDVDRAESGPRGGQRGNDMKCVWIDLKTIKAGWL